MTTHTLWPSLLLLCLAVSGCSKQPAPSPQPAAALDPMLLSPLSNNRPAPAISAPTLIHAGALPIAHIFEAGGTIRIVNATTRTLLTRATLRPHTIISIDPSSGILAAQQRLLPGPLNPDHRYEIWWEPRR